MHSDEETKSAAPKLDLDELMERVRAEVSERKILSGATAPSPDAAIAAPDFATRRWTARELLALPPAEFARASHLVFLGREPTPDEFVRLRDRLLVSQVGRMRVLRELRAAREARARRFRVKGFWRASARDRLYWSPAGKFGRFLGSLIGGICRIPRRIREFVIRIEMLERRAAESSAAHRALQSVQAANLQSTGKQIRELQNQLAATKQSLETAIAERADANAGPTQERNTQRYRGSRDDIKALRELYLPQIESCLAGSGHDSVIDIGCGRGEWLELLAQSGIAARGCDLNRNAVDECRERGLDAMLADGASMLAELPDGSCSAITAFHMIEHVPFEKLLSLLDQSLRVLRPGGLLVLETAKPGNVTVAAEKLYSDPAHRNPMHSELIVCLLKARGFGDVEVLPLPPIACPTRRSNEYPMLDDLQEKLSAPQDYAVFGRKAA